MYELLATSKLTFDRVNSTGLLPILFNYFLKSKAGQLIGSFPYILVSVICSPYLNKVTKSKHRGLKYSSVVEKCLHDEALHVIPQHQKKSVGGRGCKHSNNKFLAKKD
jgi:hypothetical protein